MPQNSSGHGSSDRDRIKNITEQVDEASSERAERRQARQAHMKSLEKRRKIRARRKLRSFITVCLVCLIIAGCVLSVMLLRSVRSGSNHDAAGISAYEGGDYEEALKEFNQALSYDSDNADYLTHIGMAYVGQKAYEEALGNFRQALDSAADERQKALAARGEGLALMYQGEYEKSQEAFEQALGYAADDKDIQADVLSYEVQALKAAGQNEKAVDACTKLISLSDSADRRVMRGMLYEELKQYDKAEEDLNTAAGMSRKDYSIYLSLYDVLSAQGKKDQAEAVLNDAVSMAGSSGKDCFYKGLLYCRMSDYAHAGEMFDKALDKGYEPALLGKGQAAMEQKDTGSAEKYYAQFFENESVDKLSPGLAARACSQYAACLIEKGDYEKASQMCQKGLDLNDTGSEQALTFNLIVSYEHLGKWEDACNLAKSYTEKYPDDEAGKKEYTFLQTRV